MSWLYWIGAWVLLQVPLGMLMGAMLKEMRLADESET